MTEDEFMKRISAIVCPCAICQRGVVEFELRRLYREMHTPKDEG